MTTQRIGNTIVRTTAARTRTSAFLCILLLAGGCGGGADTGEGAARETARVQVVLAAVAPGAVAQELELVGSLVARRRTEIVTDVDGVIQSIANSDRTFEVEVDGKRHVETLALGLG